ncbi:hypothetical protein SK53_02302 [Enterobacter sp. MGH119]|nr:hypothetical protein SK53_02302 [Enterobacter sp. MGH119]
MEGYQSLSFTCTEILLRAIDTCFTRGIDAEGDKSQQSVYKSLLNFSTNNFICTTANLSCINLLGLTNPANEEMMCRDLLWGSHWRFVY